MKAVTKEVSFRLAFTNDANKFLVVTMPCCLQTVSVLLNYSQICFFALQLQQVHTSPVATLQERKSDCLEWHNKNAVSHQCGTTSWILCGAISVSLTVQVREITALQDHILLLNHHLIQIVNIFLEWQGLKRQSSCSDNCFENAISSLFKCEFADVVAYPPTPPFRLCSSTTNWMRNITCKNETIKSTTLFKLKSLMHCRC